MRIIGEKINGTRKRVAQAIAERDAEFIQDLAVRQAAAGSTWLDVNAGTHPDREPDDLVWLIESIQSVTETPLSLDSANPRALQVAIKAVKKTPMINSINGLALAPWVPHCVRGTDICSPLLSSLSPQATSTLSHICPDRFVVNRQG